MKFRKPLGYYLGNLLILLSGISFTFIFYPLVEAYFFTPPLSIPPQDGIYLQIPKIKAQAKIIPNVDPWNERIYSTVLKKGVAHAKGTSLPGQSGTSFIFAHSSGPPWEITRNNTIFLRLGELRFEDTIYIYNNGVIIPYTVFDKKEIWPYETEYLEKDQGEILILQTCFPIGTDLKRLLVFARPQ